MPAVADPTTLIWLAKISELRLLKDTFSSVYISREVSKETAEKGLSV